MIILSLKINNTQKNNKRGFRGDELVNDIMSEFQKLAQKECETRYHYLEKLIHWELCKKLKFDHTNKWEINKPESVLENETRKIL